MVKSMFDRVCFYFDRVCCYFHRFDHNRVQFLLNSGNEGGVRDRIRADIEAADPMRRVGSAAAMPARFRLRTPSP
eukprot:gene26540-biopygen16803